MAKKKIYIQLFGGEQDGYEVKSYEVPGNAIPEFFYIHRACDNDRLREARLSNAKLHMVLSNTLAVIAYKFEKADPKDGVTGGKQYEFHRFAEADRKLSDTAI